MNLSRLIQLIQDGEPVKAGVVNRPLRQQNRNLDFLWQVLQAAEIGSTIFTYLQAAEAEVQVGMPVYYNSTRQRFERGLAAMDTTPGLGLPIVGERGRIWGIVTAKHSATVVDILLWGYAEVDISAAVGGSVTAGDYYLSGTTPGGLTKQRQPVSIPILRSDGNGRVFVQPAFVDFVDRHVHYKFPLVCFPAGVTAPPETGERHVITNPEPDAPGWLPADHPIFEGKAPAAAAFGYNFSQHEALRNCWPPLPTSGAYIEWNKALSKDVGFTGVPLGADGLCVIDANGIWWMSDAYGDVPWPLWFDSATYVSDSLSEPSSIENPRDIDMEMWLWFTKLQFATDVTVVSSLESADNLLSITCLDGETPAKAGALKIKLNLNLLVEDGSRGYQFLTGISGNKLTRGFGARGLYSLSDNVTLEGDETTLLDPDDANSDVVHHGNVGIGVSLNPTYEVPTTLVRVDGVEEGRFRETMYLGFPAEQQTELRGRIDIPHDIQFSTPALQLRLRILGRAEGTLPELTVTARRVPAGGTDDEDVPIAMDLPTSDDEFAVTITTAVELDDDGQYVDVVSAAFEVAAGDQVFYTVKRLATDDYAGEVGLLEQKGVLSNAS